MAASSQPLAEVIAEELMLGDQERAIELCSGDPELTKKVSAQLVELLDLAASEFFRVDPDRSWFSAQDAVVSFASLPGASKQAIATSLVWGCCRSSNTGTENTIHRGTFEFVLANAPEAIDAALHASWEQRLEPRFLVDHLWGVTGPDGARWFESIVRSHHMGSPAPRKWGGSIPEWTPKDWILRLDAVTESSDPPRPEFISHFPWAVETIPREASPAVCRYLVRYAPRRDDYTQIAHVKRLRRHVSNDDALDAQLFWWPPPDQDQETARWILHVVLAPGRRDAVVDAAVELGHLEANRAEFFKAPLERPQWIDQEVPWEIEAVSYVGDVEVSSGTVAAADPTDPNKLECGTAWQVDGVRSAVPAYAIGVRHPLHGEAVAACELVLAPALAPTLWTRLHPRVPDPGPGPSGGWIVNGAWLVADFESFNDIDGMLEATEDFYSEWPQIAQRVVSGKNVVIFPIGPQDHDCRSWIGSTEDGEAAVIVTEFGRIDFDLEADPIRPWGHLASD